MSRELSRVYSCFDIEVSLAINLEQESDGGVNIALLSQKVASLKERIPEFTYVEAIVAFVPGTDTYQISLQKEEPDDAKRKQLCRDLVNRGNFIPL